jgi:hypothetical protein
LASRVVLIPAGLGDALLGRALVARAQPIFQGVALEVTDELGRGQRGADHVDGLLAREQLVVLRVIDFVVHYWLPQD